ncbi:Vps52/Sac2 family protein [Colletotrichum scovillei]|uniref:Vps52/Sac2 family protein n=1 Tax=Colletotrichum scovillei TaxID=1209932 RepID=A0A9P7R3E8_9PEZI|nr:Vps52/Sac2 family protein [Colletotrichum scovillei]KAF4774465.1 Vps52/Sac2 family protein [Colletotrichum scovillei]KAG7048786.1 Vps52/Sac2 family protein [Colletotrichum scovillei]KAG7065951.1 Vps52/Sac2 family protein [Colletotrichum scovillei]KAG7068551.1 Vps52/Sac2 family protein [Colletotrichum scovillei]
MWLDRLAAQSNSSPSASQPGSRPYSPLPRRTSSSPYVTSQRPGITPRGSQLSLVSNDSSNSFLASRRVNGSGLKQSQTTYDGPDSVEILGQILDTAPASEATTVTIGENDLELDFNFEGLSLRELASSDEIDRSDADSYRRQTAEEFEASKAQFEDLHRSIAACDGVLGSVETNLTSFRNDLAAVSADIETLQSRSAAMNVRLDNRKAVEKAFGPVVEELSVSPHVVSKISEGQIDETWVRMLAEVDKRATAYKKSVSNQGESKAWADLGPLLEKLTMKAVERIRDFIVAQIKALRSPHINAQIIQQQNFLKFKDLYTFLHKHHATLAEEISQAYMNTMRWYYANQFGRYQRALEKLKLHILDKNDVLGHDEPTRRATVLSATKPAGPPHDAFNLGRRIDLLKSGNAAAISSYLAEEDQTTHYLEVPFRNFNLALIDNATAEYTFLAAFFSPPLSLQAVSRQFNYIFEPTFALGKTLTKTLTAESYDALGLLLSIRINQHLAFELQRRKVPAVDGYINMTTMLLWPRLQVVMDHHCESLRQLMNTLPTKPRAADQNKLSAAPHLVTQRFGQILQGVLALSTEAGDDEPVVTSLRRLRSEAEAFLTRYSQSFSDKRKRERFLYNNYSLISTIISDVGGKLGTEQQEHFEGLKAAFQEGA